MVPDYKEMYLTLMRETEKAINILIDVQQKCEDMYLNTSEPTIISMEHRKQIPDK